MKTTTPLLLVFGLAACAVAACSDNGATLTNGNGGGGTRAPASPDDTGTDFAHSADPAATVDPSQIRAVGSPEVTSRLHGCGKLTVSSIGDILQSRGLTGTAKVPAGTSTGVAIFQSGDTASALGAANYDGRVPEAPFGSTSAISKLFDIFTMSAYDAVDDNWAAPACPGVKLLDNGAFTKDGLSCLIGKPATDEHVAIANDALTKNPTDGAKIAVAAVMSAAHTCQ